MAGGSTEDAWARALAAARRGDDEQVAAGYGPNAADVAWILAQIEGSEPAQLRQAPMSDAPSPPSEPSGYALARPGIVGTREGAEVGRQLGGEAGAVAGGLAGGAGGVLAAGLIGMIFDDPHGPPKPFGPAHEEALARAWLAAERLGLQDAVTNAERDVRAAVNRTIPGLSSDPGEPDERLVVGFGDAAVAVALGSGVGQGDLIELTKPLRVFVTTGSDVSSMLKADLAASLEPPLVQTLRRLVGHDGSGPA